MIGNIIEKSGNAPGRMICSVPIPSTKFTIQTRQAEKSLAPAGLQGLMPKLQSKSEGTFVSEEDSFTNQSLIDNMTKEQIEEALSDVQSMISLKNVQFLRKTKETTNIAQSSTSIAKSTNNIVKSGVEEFTSFDKSVTKGLGDSKITSDAARFNLNGCRVVVKDTMIKEFQELVDQLMKSLQCTELQQKHTSHDQAQEYVQQFVNDVLSSGFCVVFDAVSAALQPQHELLNHEAMPDAPGYTLHEICEMFRSEYPNQQSLAMRMLGGVLRRREVLTSLRAYSCAYSSSCSTAGSDLLPLHSKGKNEFSCLQMALSRLMRSLGCGLTVLKSVDKKLLSQLIDQLLCLCGADSLPPSIPSLLLWTVRLPRSSDIQRLAKFACLKEYLCSSTETTYANVLWRGLLGAYGAVPLPTPHMKRPTSSSYEKHFFDCVEKYRSPEAESATAEREESEEVSKQDDGTDLSDSFVLACRWSRIDAFVEQGGLIAQLVRSFSDSLREIRSTVSSSSSSSNRPETNQVKVSQSIAVASLEILGDIVTSAGSENTLSTVYSEFLVPTFPSVVQIVRSFCDAAQTSSSTVAVQFVAEWLRVLTELSRRHSHSERLLFNDLSNGGSGDYSLVLSSLLQSSLKDALSTTVAPTVTVSGVDSQLRDWRSAVDIWSVRLLRVALTSGHGFEVLLELLPLIKRVLEGSFAPNFAGDTHNFQRLCDMRLELFLVLEQAAVSIAACSEEQLLVLLSADRVDAVVCALLHIAQDVISGWCESDTLNSNGGNNNSCNSNSSSSSNSTSSYSSSNRLLAAAQLNFLSSVVGVRIPTSSSSESSSSSSGSTVDGSTHQLCEAVLAGSSFRSRGLLSVTDKLIPSSTAGAASALLSIFQTATETYFSPDSIASQVKSLLDVHCGTQANDMQRWELSELFISWQRLSLVVQSRRSSASFVVMECLLPSSLPLQTVSVADGLLCWQTSRLQQLSQLLLLHSHCLSHPQLVETTLLTILERLSDSWSGCSVFLLGAYVRHCLTGVNVAGVLRDDCERAVALSVLGFEVQPAVAAENRTGLSVAPFNAPFGALAGQPASHSAAHWVLNCFTGRLPLSPMWRFRCLPALRGAYLVTWLQVLQRQETTLSTATTTAATTPVGNRDILGVDTLGEKLFCLVSLTLPENAAVWMREEDDPQTWGAVSDDNTGDTFSALFCSLVAKLTPSAVASLSSLAHDKFSKLNVAAALRKRQNAPSSSSSQSSNASALLQLCDKVVDGALEQCTQGEMHAAVLSLFIAPQLPWAVKERVWKRLGEARLLHLVESAQVWTAVLVDAHLLHTVEDTPSTWAGKRRLCGCILSAVKSLRQESDRSWVIVSLGLLSVAKMLFAEAFQTYQEIGTDGPHSLEVRGEAAKYLLEHLNSPPEDCWVAVGVVAAAQFWFLDRVQIAQIDQTAATSGGAADSLLTAVLELGSGRTKALAAQVALLAPEILDAAVRVDSAGASILLKRKLLDLVAAAVIHS